MDSGDMYGGGLDWNWFYIALVLVLTNTLGIQPLDRFRIFELMLLGLERAGSDTLLQHPHFGGTGQPQWVHLRSPGLTAEADKVSAGARQHRGVEREAIHQSGTQGTSSSPTYLS